MSILISLIATPIGKADNRQIDYSKSPMFYCVERNNACEGYVPAAPEQYLPPWPPGFKDYQGYYHNDLAGLDRFASFLVTFERNSNNAATLVRLCNDITSSCLASEAHYSAVLPMCGAGVSIDCLRDIVVTDAENKSLPYTVVGQFPTGNPQNFTGSAALKVPNGTAATLIKVPGAPHAGGDTYLVKAIQYGARMKNESSFHFESLKISINAVKITDGNYGYGVVSTDSSMYPDQRSLAGLGIPATCAIASQTQCAARYTIPAGLHFGLSVDLSNKITGWLHGRVKAPSVDVSTNGSGGTTLKMIAESIKIPVNAVWVNNQSAPTSIKDYYSNRTVGGSWVFGNMSDPLSEVALMRDANEGHNQNTLDEYLAWMSSLGDKAQALSSAWVIQTMSGYQVEDQIQRCLNQTDSLAGIVTTNAAEYLDGPPIYDKNSKSLDYKVAATHYEPDGTTAFKGTYDLVMSSKVARCIYGFTNAPVSATITVTSDSGANNLATTLVKESDGWLSLSAYNFTYSSPIIKVILSGTVERAVVTPTATPTPTPSATVEPVVKPSVVATPTAKPTIAPKKPVVVKTTCVKGKLTKVVTGTKCPAGYKKK